MPVSKVCHDLIRADILTVNLALSSMTSYPSTVGVIGLSPSCWLPTGSDMDRGQLEYSTDGSRDPFTLARVTGLWCGGGVLLRLQRDWRCEPPLPLLWSSPAVLVMDEQDELLETLPSDEARCGRLSLPLPPDKALSMGTGTGTKGDAIFPELMPNHPESQQGSSHLRRCCKVVNRNYDAHPEELMRSLFKKQKDKLYI